ncbi:MAG: hypothetical protein JRM77_07715 [Nitrososphaerota archaeon]|nr:hypothetical protein [Nitrososphaerota archaeon]
MALAPRASAAFNFLTGMWVAIAGWGFGPSLLCPRSGCPIPALQGAVPVLGVILVLDALVCYIGFRSAFMVGGALSAIVAAIALYNWAGHYGGEAWTSLVVLSLMSLVFDLLALRPREQLKEQANPMNLPVFG